MANSIHDGYGGKKINVRKKKNKYVLDSWNLALKINTPTCYFILTKKKKNNNNLILIINNILIIDIIQKVCKIYDVICLKKLCNAHKPRTILFFQKVKFSLEI